MTTVLSYTLTRLMDYVEDLEQLTQRCDTSVDATDIVDRAQQAIDRLQQVQSLAYFQANHLPAE